MFVKPSSSSSPYSSPPPGSGVNYYASYFGSQHHHHNQQSGGASSPLSSSSTVYGGGMSTSFGGGGNYMMSPTAPSYGGGGGYSSSSSLGGGATAPFLLHGGSSYNNHHHHHNHNQSGPGGFACQFSPPQTQIIGGVSKSPPLAMSASSPSSGRQQQHQQHQTSSPRQLYSQNSMSHSSPPRNDGTEPMHYSPIHPSSNQGYGSPSSSSYGMYNSSNHGSPNNSSTSFLPSYLLGLDQHHHHSFQSGSGYLPIVSPGGPLKSNLKGGGGVDQATFLVSNNNPSGFQKKTVMFDGSTNFGPDDSENNYENGEGKESADIAVKVKGPPKHGFGHSTGSSAKEFLSSPVMQESYCPRYSEEEIMSASQQAQGATTMNGCGSSSSPSSQESPLSNWVTVFGFPSGASSFILTQFSTCGKILRVKSTPGSNWLHLRFSNKIEARRALSKNGKVVGGSIMVGVMNSDPKVVQDAEETPATELSSGSPPQAQAGPSTSGGALRERNAWDSSTDSFKSRLRPLATGSVSTPTFSTPVSIKSYSPFPVVARQSIEVERNADGNQSLPSSSNGIFTKAMEFMFGW